jgi:hypothetical protein
VAFEEVEPDDGAKEVYQPDIIDKKENRVVTPGYNPFQKKEDSADAAQNAEFKIRSYQASDESAVIEGGPAKRTDKRYRNETQSPTRPVFCGYHRQSYRVNDYGRL